jgi:hypothetical protein
MIRFSFLVFAIVLFTACASVETDPMPELSEVVKTINQSKEIDGVTVSVASLAYMPHDGGMLAELDGEYAHLFDGNPAVARLDISANNASGAPVELYPATFGSVIIDGEQIDLVSFQFFANGGTLDNTLQDGTSASAGVWFPLSDSQFSALQNGANVRIIFTDGIEPIYTFEITE